MTEAASKAVRRKSTELVRIDAIVEGRDDWPVVMVRLNRYAAGADKNYRLLAACIEYAVIHRCDGDRTLLC